MSRNKYGMSLGSEEVYYEEPEPKTYCRNCGTETKDGFNYCHTCLKGPLNPAPEKFILI